MYLGMLKFNQIPDIGFAMAHYSKTYRADYGKNKKKTVEIAYINSGEVKLKLYGKEFIASEGSVVVLFRQLPISTCTIGNKINSHYTVLAEFENYDFELFENDTSSEKDCLVIPFITPPSPLTEIIRKKICAIAVSMEDDGEKNALSCAINFLSILCEISNERYKQNANTSRTSIKSATLISDYIDNNLDKPISLEALSNYIGKTPNYTGYIFKKVYNISVTQYINMQKTKKIAFLMQNNGLSFRDACECVGLTETTYGYRLFKKYIGLTPGEYMKISKIQTNN
ncbi:MAG: helix-turn-helix transcriptional regulator [Clostridia bacterium]|nr:helix-turn-helix transcriptional regulator [Clostridia bacterium]